MHAIMTKPAVMKKIDCDHQKNVMSAMSHRCRISFMAVTWHNDKGENTTLIIFLSDIVEKNTSEEPQPSPALNNFGT